MRLWSLPWVELAIVVPLVGALCVSQFRDAVRAFGWGVAFTGGALACALLAALGFYFGPTPVSDWSVQPALFGQRLLGVDELSAPLLPLVALLHFLTALATG